MAELKPARRFIAEGRRSHLSQLGWIGYWAFPGMVPDYVRDPENDTIREFIDRESAAIMAKITLANALLARITDTRKDRYEFMAPNDFAADLREAGLSATQFARLYGTTQETVVNHWIAGMRAVPHPARVLLQLFLRHPETIAMAEAVTDASSAPRYSPMDNIDVDPDFAEAKP